MASRLSETGTNDHPAETTVKVPSAFLPGIRIVSSGHH